MRYLSTRGASPPVSFAEAVRRGLAPDGGLYLPAEIPRAAPDFWPGLRGKSLASTAAALLEPFVAEVLEPAVLEELLDEALSFPVPVVPLEPGVRLVELFHGPTLAFKDVGARFLARVLARLTPPDEPPVTVLVATSGDTGGAVAAAFHRVPRTRVVVLYPRGRVSPRQERQFSTLGDNVLALAVAGTFDDCQRLAKEALADAPLARAVNLTSANSINAGRLLPQMAYYAYAWAQLPVDDPPPVFCVPSGNFGNLTAGLLAWRAGLPARRFLAATNVNDVVPQWLATGRFAPRPSVATLANAMDVGNPSNLERIRYLFADDLASTRAAVWTSVHPDPEIRDEILRVHGSTGAVLDPHTAVGTLAVRRYHAEIDADAPALVLATAHPAKFHHTVEALIGHPLPLPEALAAALQRPVLSEPLSPRFGALRQRLLEWSG